LKWLINITYQICLFDVRSDRLTSLQNFQYALVVKPISFWAVEMLFKHSFFQFGEGCATE
jgi:hypothetical protein